MRHIVRFRLVSLAVLFADASVLVGTSARGPIRAADLHSENFAKPASAVSIPNFRDRPRDQGATETATERNKALTLKPSDALGNKNMTTAQGFVHDNSVMHRTCSNFAKGPAALKQKNSFVHAKWNIPRWAAGDDIFAEDDKVISRNSVRRNWKKILSANVNGDQEQLKPNPPETVSPGKHLFYKGGRNHGQNSK